MNRMLVHVVMIVLVAGKASTSGTWKLTNTRVTFGKDVYLMCLLDEVECNTSKQEPDPRGWTGGPQYQLLCMDALQSITKTIKDKNNINNDNMAIEIMLHKVNPVPNCSALLKGRFINDATVTVMKWYTYYNDVKVIYNFPVDSVACEGRLQILCNLVYTNVSIFDEYIDICQENNESLRTIILLAIGCCVFVMILLICIYLVKRNDTMYHLADNV
ncbi:Hypothetical predicted protein [Mytilus galloprovincialis]|uniref:Uncharacterized protein n=1 Tax=Mytilus galloprovincialis TaxID=29158 RepID=A0A8B6BYG4_MYTGA|nr:Hypothetical predicted protein [Mytilus galloprovincialis]